MLGIGGSGGKHASILGRSRAALLEAKRSSLSLLEVQSPCVLARVPSMELNKSPPSSSVNKLVVSTASSPSEAGRKSLESNNESDDSTALYIMSKKKSVKPTKCCIMMKKTSTATSKWVVQGRKRNKSLDLFAFYVPIPCGSCPPIMCRGALSFDFPLPRCRFLFFISGHISQPVCLNS